VADSPVTQRSAAPLPPPAQISSLQLYRSPDPNAPEVADADLPPAPPEGAQSIARTLRTLELLAFAELSAPELAASMQIHPRTARRLLTQLTIEGYAARAPGARGRYRATLRLVALGHQLIARARLPRVAAPYVAALAARTPAVAHLWIPSYRSVGCVLHADPARELVPPPQLRELLPAHATAAGKVLLAHRHAWREDLLTRSLERYTEHTLTDPTELRTVTDGIRQRGYATEQGEYDHRSAAIAAPVCIGDETVAALAITLSARRLPPEDSAVIATHVTTAAAALSRALTHPEA
jgi:DNA-binding IclR family transcriptional regulator